MIHLPRTMHAGLQGPDVRAYSHIYRHLGLRQRPETKFFGLHMVDATMAFQHHHKLQVDGVIGSHTFDALRADFDRYVRRLLQDEIQQLSVTPRDLITGAAVAMYRHRPFPYEEIRPYPESLLDVYRRGSDCSGTSTEAYKYAYLHFGPNRVPDPNGLRYDGYGYTGTLLGHGSRTYHPRPGDLAFFYPTFSHVGVVLDAHRTFSHGAPGDPRIIPTEWATMFRTYVEAA